MVAHGDMMGMDMSMPTATSTGAMSSSTASHSMDMGGMHGGNSCKISMLWNWTVKDACFLSKQWHITSNGMFAGSCIGVILLVISLEFLRRVGREYDAFILRRARLRAQYLNMPLSSSQTSTPGEEDTPKASSSTTPVPVTTGIRAPNCPSAGFPVRPTLVEQLVRALMHMVQFAVAYFIMLLAMYFNGYIIICIFIGAFLGSFIFSWEPLQLGKENDATSVTKCCG
ncbi:Copper Transporter integral membrane protein that functions in high affinity copper transport [Aspergillus alliaceus]|uniref:Copper transport protein n=1 Tax=Petromyces alliaceus TaxID=209559 RepID=A0A5N7CF06_PETAA|nr:Ctr copper transporter family-domain-containing protein [Aspergillus alliaceus]KAF5865730.1 Copper Transporter integral membrane protein that functions in high affinity copper transport [Aspergillus burnettii]